MYVNVFSVIRDIFHVICINIIVAVYRPHYRVLMSCLCPSVLSVCVSFCLCVSVYTITEKCFNPFQKIVVYENCSEEFDIGHCLIKVMSCL